MDRAQVIVHRDKSILMIKHRLDGRQWWALPGGGVEPDEAASTAALRELQEECLVRGKIVKQLGEYQFDASSTVFTYEVDIGEQEPQLGSDPEVPDDEQAMIALKWLRLAEMSERDRAYVLAGGLLGIGVFLEEILSWSDDRSYPELKPLD